MNAMPLDPEKIKGAAPDQENAPSEITLQADHNASATFSAATDSLESKSTVTEIQRAKLITLLRNGAKTTIDLRTHGIMMPATRVFELKQLGYDILTELVPLFDTNGFRHRKCARYHLADEKAEGPTK